MAANAAQRLAARITAKNRANEIANGLYDQMVTIFRPLIGTKVLKQDRTFLKKVANLLPTSDYPDKHPQPTVMHYNSTSEYTVTFTVKVCAYDGNGGCAYEETVVYVADLDNGIVKDKIYDPPESRTDFTADEITKLRAVFTEKRNAFESARSDLHPFGEIDR